MKQILLDTSFILTSIRNKIDFIEELTFKGLKILVPKQVLQEITRITKSKKKLRFRDEAALALKVLENSEFKKIDLKSKNTDNGIVKYSKDHDVIIATLDRELKRNVKGQRLIIRGKKKLEIV